MAGNQETDTPQRPAKRHSISVFFPFYNEERFHESLGYLTPSQVYHQEARA